MTRPEDASGALRARTAPLVMAAVRLVAAALVTRPAVRLLVGGDSFLAAVAGAPLRDGLAAVLGVGLAAFVWPRTCLAGAATLVAGVGAFEWLCRSAGAATGSLTLHAAAIVGVLAAGEWLARVVAARTRA